jgi:hypothetical protein
MPSPLGHALGGAAAGWTVAPLGNSSRRTALVRTAGFMAAGTLADLDLLFGAHRGPTHGLGAAVLVGLAVWMWSAARPTRSRGGSYSAVRVGLAVAAAYATHTLLDWLGSDSSPPLGIMALWPVTREYYVSPYPIFLAVSRQYCQPDFWLLTFRAIAREVAILGPLAALVWLRQRSIRP